MSTPGRPESELLPLGGTARSAKGAPMNWGSAGEFFAMGGYGVYVWGSYGITAALIGFEAWLTLRRRRRALCDALASASSEAPR